ncbi:Furcatin hydrolase [Sesamum alatum]|uniref:Furcatin hydrolase n=1 Tax=Sesamum alatum TaxID=300844 RepID=A0AAE1XPB1_9LAMI|nr:Furcatin hydrolase [Sesamum alatum]
MSIGLGLNYDHFNRSVFSPGFLFGAASSAYQYEGAAFEVGKGPSIWDTFTHKFPGKILDRSNGDVADNFYYLYKEDVKLMKYIGLDAFRMSISWSRILPRGKLNGGVNKEGIAFYNNIFDELLANGITPLVTLFHWDLPQTLEDEYRGFLSPQVIDDFRDFGDLCFKEFGDRIKHWITINEPFAFANGGYDGSFLGNLAPAHDINGVPIGEPTEVSTFFVYPKGLYKLLVYTKKKYKNPTIFITETGIADRKNGTIKHIRDFHRIDFYNRHFWTVQRAIKQGVKVKGIFGWSFLDDFEWGDGYDIGFGFFYVDFQNELKRIPKLSAIWFKHFLSKSGEGKIA